MLYWDDLPICYLQCCNNGLLIANYVCLCVGVLSLKYLIL
jgi:hypothetical protein